MTGVVLRHLGRDGASELGPFPATSQEPRAHAARHPQPPPRRLWRAGPRATKASRSRRCRSTREVPDRLLEAARGLGPRAQLGEKHGFRNAQTTVHRADRHDRPRHGLRHHRHRARLRAGEVQEARRRRLLQDHQPEPCPRRCARSATRGADRRDRRLRRRPRHAEGRARASTTRRCEARLRRGARRSREGAGGAFDIKLRVQQAGRSARSSARKKLGSPPRSWTTWSFDLLKPPRLHQGRHRGRQRLLSAAR
jgi:hypothetical protein